MELSPEQLLKENILSLPERSLELGCGTVRVRSLSPYERLRMENLSPFEKRRRTLHFGMTSPRLSRKQAGMLFRNNFETAEKIYLAVLNEDASESEKNFLNVMESIAKIRRGL